MYSPGNSHSPASEHPAPLPAAALGVGAPWPVVSGSLKVPRTRPSGGLRANSALPHLSWARGPWGGHGVGSLGTASLPLSLTSVLTVLLPSAALSRFPGTSGR